MKIIISIIKQVPKLQAIQLLHLIQYILCSYLCLLKFDLYEDSLVIIQLHFFLFNVTPEEPLLELTRNNQINVLVSSSEWIDYWKHK